MFHRSTSFTRRQQISAAVLALALMLTMTLPAAAAPNGPTFDFGDLPPSYPTYIHDGGTGPYHSISESGPFLGFCVDSEENGQPDYSTIPAQGDDVTPPSPDGQILPSSQVQSCTDDEDGVSLAPGRNGGSNNGGWTNGSVANGQGGAVRVTITGGPACLGAFFDFSYNPGAESNTVTLVQQLYELLDGSYTAVNPPFAVGTHTFYFDIPANAFTGSTRPPVNARFRVTSRR